MKKYELTEETKEWYGHTLHRIKALRDFGDVKAGDLGGWIEKEENLSHDGGAWVYDDARVYDNARVYGNAWVCGDARVYDNARVYGNAWVCGDARVYDDASVCDNAWVCDNAEVQKTSDYATVSGLGSAYRCTTFYRLKDGGVGVRCGCFCGTLAEFEAKVKETHGDSKYAREYLAAAELMRIHFEVES